jgi:hypothetical protein
MTRTLPVGLLIFALAATKGDGGKSPTSVQDAKKPELAVTAVAMAEEFVADPVAADAKYKGKLVEITGQYGTELASRRVLYLAGAKQKDGKPCWVRCWVVAEVVKSQRLLQLAPGQKLKVVGRYNKMDQGEIEIRDCTLTELEASNLKPVASTALAKEFEADQKATRKKYEKREVIVSGPILEFNKNDAGYGRLKLAGTDKIHVGALVDPSDLQYLEKNFKKGDTVIIRGWGVANPSLLDEDQVIVVRAVVVPKKAEGK